MEPNPADSQHRIQHSITDSVPVPVRRRKFEEHVGAMVLMALVLITLVNVVVRYFTDQSFAWTEEISVFLLLALTLAGAAVASTRDSHIRIEFFYDRAKPNVRRALVFLSMLCTLAMFALLMVLLVRAGWQEYTFEETTTGVGVPRWWYTAWLPPLALLVVIRTWVAGIRKLKSIQDSSQPGNDEVR